MGNTGSSFVTPKSELEDRREKIFLEEEEEIIREVLRSDLGCTDDSQSYFDETDKGGNPLDPSLYLFPFENVIFEGGGNKGLAYCGAVKCLEELNILPQIKRIGGASAGAITAALVALGYGHKDILNFLSEDVEKTFIDHSYGYLSLLPNLITGWGWNPGKKIYDWFGDKIEAKTGNRDLTFYQLYKMKGIELCVVVTNLNRMRAEYCHPKTTPNMSIREALRMSMSIPVVFMPCKHNSTGNLDMYVDGGVLCNFPIQCFDGWYLSMEKNDSFLLRMQKLDCLSQMFSLRNMFQHEGINDKTVGFLLYDDTEVEVMRERLDKRKGATFPKKPSRATTLFRKQLLTVAAQNKLKTERAMCQQAAEAFMKALNKYNIEDDVHIDKQELMKAMEDESIFTPKHKTMLFGKNISVDDAFNHLDRDGNGLIDIQELLRFLETRNIRMQNRIQGFNRTEIHNLMDFGSALQNSWTTNMKYLYIEQEDIKRIVGINTGHVGTSDYVLENEDREFLAERGYNATMAFLRSYIEDNVDSLVKKPTQNGNTPKPVEGEEYYVTGTFNLDKYKSLMLPRKSLPKL